MQMLAKEDDERERMALIDDLTRSTNRATHLVEQLLRVARVSHQPVNMKALPLYHTTASVIAEMANVAAEKQLDISLEGQKEASVCADELLMKLMISNLMDNAINVLPQDGMWCLSIRDTGRGISGSEREAGFHRFYRAANAVTDGTGLGLAIVGEIIDRMSAKIALKTPESGQGLRVEVLLPKA